MTIDPREIKRLDDMLTKEGISHDFIQKSFAMGNHYEVCIPSDSAWHERKGYSVSINSLTYGHTAGLIEFWDGREEPIGNLTAEKALELIRKKVM